MSSTAERRSSCAVCCRRLVAHSLQVCRPVCGRQHACWNYASKGHSTFVLSSKALWLLLARLRCMLC
jgi:hypothetical protein